MSRVARTACAALALPDAALDRLSIEGRTALPSALSSAFPVSTFAGGAVGAAALAISELIGAVGHDAPAVRVDRRLASLWFGVSIAPIGWELPAAWDAIAGDYASADGWIRLHTNAPLHRAAALRVLGCAEDRAAVAAAVALHTTDALETAVVEAGGCAAAMRTVSEWHAHPQGSAVADESLIDVLPFAVTTQPAWRPARTRPLQGLRVLDLTRVLAGPVATRFLAGYGAEVLRIDPPSWEEPGLVPDVTLGKRCARLDLERADDRAKFESLLAHADVLVHGFRPGALDALGYDAAARRAIRVDLIDVSLDAYGWTGPWQTRRGFDSLVQMSSGIAAAGMAWKGSDRPLPLPVQALDHAAGYLMAAAAVAGLTRRLVRSEASTSRVSLARTACALLEEPDAHADPGWRERERSDLSVDVETTAWGPARRLQPPAVVDGVPMAWTRPASALGSAEARWLRRGRSPLMPST